MAAVVFCLPRTRLELGILIILYCFSFANKGRIHVIFHLQQQIIMIQQNPSLWCTWDWEKKTLHIGECLSEAVPKLLSYLEKSGTCRGNLRRNASLAHRVKGMATCSLEAPITCWPYVRRGSTSLIFNHQRSKYSVMLCFKGVGGYWSSPLSKSILKVNALRLTQVSMKTTKCHETSLSSPHL